MPKSNLHFAALVVALLAVLAGVLAVFVFAPRLTMAANDCGCGGGHWTAATWAALGGATGLLLWLGVAAVLTLRRTREFLARSLAGARLAERIAGVDVTILPHSDAVFCYGFRRPRVALGEKLLTRLTPDELAAVLAHEAAHIRRADPLRLLIVEVVAIALGSRLGRQLANAFRLDVELDADEAAVARRGARALARAFLAILEAPRQPIAVAVPFLSVSEARALQLLGERPRQTPWAAIAAAIVLVAGLGLGLRASAGALAQQPDPPAGSCRAPALCPRPATAWTVRPRVTCLVTPTATWCVHAASVRMSLP